MSCCCRHLCTWLLPVPWFPKTDGLGTRTGVGSDAGNGMMNAGLLLLDPAVVAPPNQEIFLAALGEMLQVFQRIGQVPVPHIRCRLEWSTRRLVSFRREVQRRAEREKEKGDQ